MCLVSSWKGTKCVPACFRHVPRCLRWFPQEPRGFSALNAESLLLDFSDYFLFRFAFTLSFRARGEKEPHDYTSN